MVMIMMMMMMVVVVVVVQLLRTKEEVKGQTEAQSRTVKDRATDKS